MALYEAFWDESGVNKDDEWLTVAGFVATPGAWAEFSAEWQAQLDRFHIPMFHANRFNAPDAPEYASWTREDRIECSTALTDAILRNVVGSVGISVPAAAIRKVAPASLKGRVGHPYAIASRLCIVEAAGLLRGNLAIDGDLTIDHTFALGADGYGQLMAVRDHESARPARVDHLALGTVSFGSQAENPPLQAADFLAWELNRRRRQQDDPARPTIRTPLRRFWDLPRRWFYVPEADVGAQMLMAFSVEWDLGNTTKAAHRRRRLVKRP